MEPSMRPQAVAGAEARQGSTSNARSCFTCAKAKAKCVRKPGHEICDRCARLRKDCSTKAPILRKRKPVKLTRTAQLENLENKLEDLVHALSVQQAQQRNGTDNGQPSPPESQTPSERGRAAVDEVLQTVCFDPENPEYGKPLALGGAHGVLSAVTAPPSYLSRPDTDSSISMQEAEVLFDRYRRLMAPNMPFVIIPDNVDVWRLTETKPFLMQVISTMTSWHDLPRAQHLAKNLMRQISERILIQDEKSLELLQGILLFITWYHLHLHTGQQSSNLVHLAMALVTDLNIDRGPGSCNHASKAVHGPGTTPAVTNDERRALLGTFYLASMLSTSFRKLDPPRWTSWMTECVNTLEQNTEYESDAFLVQLIRTQHIMEDMVSLDQNDVPINFYANAFSSDLDKIVIPPKPGRLQYLLKLQLAAARITVWDRSFMDLVEGRAKRHELQIRLEGVWRCVEAMRVYVDLFFAIPNVEYLNLPFPAFAQFGFTFITLMRLATLDIDGWDLKAFREQIDFATLMEQASTRFETVQHTRPDGMIIINDAFGKWASKTRWLKQFYESKMDPSLARMSVPPPPGEITSVGKRIQPILRSNDNGATGPQQPKPSSDMGAAPDFLTYFDEAFWNNINFNDFDFGLQEMQMG